MYITQAGSHTNFYIHLHEGNMDLMDNDSRICSQSDIKATLPNIVC